MQRRGKLFYLLLSILFVLVAYPFFEANPLASKLFAIFISFILISGTYAVSRESLWKRITSLILAVPTIVIIWADEFVDVRMVEILDYIFVILFLSFTVFCVLSHIVRAKRITKDILAGAVSAYLLLGFTWSMLYGLVQSIRPGSFRIFGQIPTETIQEWGFFTYYSFTTLTTLGYGDITPVTSYAQSLAILEATFGVLFSAILIARLVGMYLFQTREESKNI
ncbi:MAG: two pore domain potassium channel family protein [Candidatus Omnitrophica bacterium]|nr:two pore domain potassium channel family protein [Candidatus Omnitrophota bacterium]